MKIPENAKKVFSGVIFDVYHWEQKMFDGSTATFERIRRNDSASIIPVIDGKICILTEKQPDWDDFATGLVAGRLDDNEDPLDAAKRELFEETGLVSDDWELYFKFSFSDKIYWSIHHYIARDCVKKQEPDQDPGEQIKLSFVSFDEFVEIASRDDFRNSVFTQKLLDMRLNNKVNDLKKKLF